MQRSPRHPRLTKEERLRSGLDRPLPRLAALAGVSLVLMLARVPGWAAPAPARGPVPDDPRLLQPERTRAAFAGGAATARVIVNLVPPPGYEGFARWSDRAALEALRGESRLLARR